MSRFHASIRGDKEVISQRGSKESSIEGHTEGLNIGVHVVCYANYNDEDEIKIMLTSGLNHHLPAKLIGVFTTKDLED